MQNPWENVERRREAGFTLVELMIAVMIIATLSLFSVPQLRGLLRSYQLNGAANMVWVDLQRARMLAIKQNEAIRVNFLTSTSYAVVQAGSGIVVVRRDLSSDYPGVTVGITTGTSVTFASTGTVPPPNQTVRLQSWSGSKSFTVLVTGAIREIS